MRKYTIVGSFLIRVNNSSELSLIEENYLNGKLFEDFIVIWHSQREYVCKFHLALSITISDSGEYMNSPRVLILNKNTIVN